MTECINHVLVPGTFDPITYGHIDVVRRARRICPRVTVAVARSLGKNGVGTTFTLEERVDFARRASRGLTGSMSCRSTACSSTWHVRWARVAW